MVVSNIHGIYGLTKVAARLRQWNDDPDLYMPWSMIQAGHRHNKQGNSSYLSYWSLTRTHA